MKSNICSVNSFSNDRVRILFAETLNVRVDVVQTISLELDAKKIGILLKSRKRPVANLALPPSATQSFANICLVSFSFWE